MGNKIYNIKAIKTTLGESGSTNDNRIRRAAELAQNDYETATHNIRGISDIISTPTQKEIELINFGAIAWFYYLENGDETTLKKYQDDMIPNYIKGRFGRPRAKVRGPL